jgi:hypothetical protein
MAAAALGLIAVMVLCLPVVGYLSLALSGVGLLLGLSGLVAALGEGGAAHRRAGKVAATPLLGGRPSAFPLAGMAACLVALALALLPFLID